MVDVTGQTAVVTGGTDGIGAATALALRRRGAAVTVVGRSPTKADALLARSAAEPGPGSVRAVLADFASMATVAATVENWPPTFRGSTSSCTPSASCCPAPNTPPRASRRTSP